ncbi:VOC family protein [Candidatus Omnitrophota bacterium]
MKAIRHIGIVVSNLDEALYFYKDILGLKIQREMLESGEYIDKLSTLKGVKVRTIKMCADDGNLVELLYYESHLGEYINRDICDMGYSHVAFTVENLDNEYERLKKNGIKFKSIPQISPDRKAKVSFCYDPEDNLIELVEVLA